MWAAGDGGQGWQAMHGSLVMVEGRCSSGSAAQLRRSLRLLTDALWLCCSERRWVSCTRLDR